VGFHVTSPVLTLHSVYDRSTVPYCRSWNLQFAEELQARLPVEMRNLVYHYLWDRDTIVGYPDLARLAGGSKCWKSIVPVVYLTKLQIFLTSSKQTSSVFSPFARLLELYRKRSTPLKSMSQYDCQNNFCQPSRKTHSKLVLTRPNACGLLCCD
jgi:hypothetical protein